MTVTFITVAIIAAAYIVDTFILVPKNIKIFSKQHLLDGDKSGYVTKALKLSYSEIRKGQVWRLFSQMLLHNGIFHLLFNCMALLIAGYAIESTVGWQKMILCLLFSQIFSGLFIAFGLKFDDGQGASPGIYGLIAMYVVFALKQKNILFSSLPWYIVLLLFIYAVVGMCINRIDRWEHLSGFAGGILFGIISLYAF